MKTQRNSVAGSPELSDVLVSVNPRNDGEVEISVENILFRRAMSLK